MNEPCYVIVANPDSKRWQLYSRDLTRYWQRRDFKPEVVLLPWRDVVPRLGRIDDLLPHRHPAVLRLESPGRDHEVTRLLLEAGDHPQAGCAWRSVEIPKGALLRPSLLHRGFCTTLHGLRAALDRQSHLMPLACPLAIAELFDKSATSRRLTDAGLPCPATLPSPADARQLLDLVRTHRMKTAYVKLNTGSSATGIAVLHALDDPPWAVTSMVRIGASFRNTRKLQKITGPELDEVLNFLLHEGALIQEGIAMAQIDGQNFDVRVVVIHGEPAFTIFRLSGLPMTNLHLGGRRGAWADCRASIPTRAWLDALDHCVAGARLYTCAAVGVDLVFERGCAGHFILELNAFGDFFPGLTDAAGRTIHEAEIAMTAYRWIR